MSQTEILECGHPPTPQEEGSVTTGYGTDKDGKRHCFACCADRDRASMIETGRAVLYFAPRRVGTAPVYEVSNWPGSMRYTCTSVRHSRRPGFGGMYPREDFHFNGPDGFVWHGFRQGHHTMIAHCKRTKVKTKHD